MRITAAFLLGLTVALPAQEADPLPPLEAEAAMAVEEQTSAAEPSPASEQTGGEQPSAELIIEANEAVVDEPLPQLEGQLPGEENIFGDDLFGVPDFYTPTTPEIPSAPPVIEDPAELERKMRVKFRRLKARIENSPELQSLKEMANRAPTPEDYRAARRSYYALLFDKVRKADGSLKDYADKLEKQSVAPLYQTRIEPTIALNPPPQPQPQAQFIPVNEYPDALPMDEEPVALP